MANSVDHAAELDEAAIAYATATYSVPVTFAIRRSDTIAISSVP